MIRIGGHSWEEAPDGVYLAKCTKVDSDYKFMQNRKVALYFTLIDGDYIGSRARMFFPKRRPELAKQMGSEFGPKSKLFNTIHMLNPASVGQGKIAVEIDIEDLFLGNIYEITVEKRGKGKNSNAIVVSIEHPPVPF